MIRVRRRSGASVKGPKPGLRGQKSSRISEIYIENAVIGLLSETVAGETAMVQ